MRNLHPVMRNSEIDLNREQLNWLLHPTFSVSVKDASRSDS